MTLKLWQPYESFLSCKSKIKNKTYLTVNDKLLNSDKKTKKNKKKTLERLYQFFFESYKTGLDTFKQNANGNNISVIIAINNRFKGKDLLIS